TPPTRPTPHKTTRTRPPPITSGSPATSTPASTLTASTNLKSKPPTPAETTPPTPSPSPSQTPSAKPCAVRKRTREGSYRPTCRARLHPGARPVAVDVLRTQAVPPGPLGEILRAVSGNGAPALKDASIDCLVHRKRPPRNLLCRKRRSADRAVVPPPEG